uniref:Gypsy retrotransposon integrase-like protein 1 n=1 Tax=Latimeria chalumnae TaxID=7897 RepID=H3A7L4_LATCH
ISNGFWSIPLHEDCQYKFAFTFQHTQYTWTCLLQGFHNSPSIFHFHMKVTLSSFSQPKLLLQYVDDLLIATETREEHLKLLDELLKLLSAAGLKVNPRKAQLLKQVSFLGITIGVDGRTPNQHKVEVIRELPLPNSDATLRSFPGLVSYSKEFIPGFAQLSKPLYDLLKKGTERKWTEPHTEAVSTLKQRLMTAPALINPDLTAPFHLEVTATEMALATVLAQEQHHVKHPIAYASRVLTPVGQNYTLCEKNLLATFWVVKHATYIVGLNPIILHTSHMPTDFLLSQRIKEGGVSNARLTHWSLLLQDRDIAIQRYYLEGKAHTGFGIHYRKPNEFEWSSIMRSCTLHSGQYAELAAIIDIREVIKCLKQGSPLREGPPYRNYKRNLCLTSDGVIPQQQHLRQEIYSVHDTPTGRHQGQEKTYQRMQTVGWWPSIGKNIQDYCNNCLVCAQDNPSPCKRNALLHPQWAEGPWTQIQIDFIGPLSPTARGNKFVLVVTDLVEAFPVKNCTVQATAKALLEQLFTRWGLPLSIDSDQGTHFTGKVLQDALQLLGVAQKFDISYHPQSSGQVDRLNRQIKTMFRKYVAVNGKNWDQFLPLLLMCIRATPSSASKVTPYEVMTGRQMRLPEH